jgi:hypothetical protein
MGIRVTCENCGYKYNLKEETAGKKAKCKICKAVFTVPQLPEVTTTPGGSTVYAHAPRAKDFEFAIGDTENIEQISEHIVRHVGPIGTVWHEIVSDLVHLDVHWVQPTAERRYHTLVTSGMSDRPMTVPEGAEAFRFAELMLCLPADWQISETAFKDERWYWPVRLLKILARFPHEYDTWLAYWHTIPNDDPPEPYAPNTKLCCAFLAPPQTMPKDFSSLEVNSEKTIRFYAVMPLYREEMDLKLQQGTDPLLEKLARAGVTELVNINRKNVCKKTGWW